jgi:3',5'-cyclic AMP phosphodiesterase CpdA
MQKLGGILAQTAKQRLFRVLLIHQPPLPGIVSWRKRLTDAAALRSLLTRCGAELVLHGHAHKSVQNSLQTSAGWVPVMGASSASSRRRAPRYRARYYLYRVTPRAAGWDVRISIRVYATEEHCFVAEDERIFHLNRTT